MQPSITAQHLLDTFDLSLLLEEDKKNSGATFLIIKLSALIF